MVKFPVNDFANKLAVLKTLHIFVLHSYKTTSSQDCYSSFPLSLSLSLSLPSLPFLPSISLLLLLLSSSFSIRIEGDIPGFELTVSDKKLVTILNIVTSLELPPPSLANTTTYYDNLPVRKT